MACMLPDSGISLRVWITNNKKGTEKVVHEIHEEADNHGGCSRGASGCTCALPWEPSSSNKEKKKKREGSL